MEDKRRSPDRATLAMAVDSRHIELTRHSWQSPLLPAALQGPFDEHDPVAGNSRPLCSAWSCACDEYVVGRSRDDSRREACEHPRDSLRVPPELNCIDQVAAHRTPYTSGAAGRRASHARVSQIAGRKDQGATGDGTIRQWGLLSFTFLM